MLVFRSEEHVERWQAQWNMPRGALIGLENGWRLAKAWYGPDRREANWRRKTVDEVEALFHELGFISPFWRLR